MLHVENKKNKLAIRLIDKIDKQEKKFPLYWSLNDCKHRTNKLAKALIHLFNPKGPFPISVALKQN